MSEPNLVSPDAIDSGEPDNVDWFDRISGDANEPVLNGEIVDAVIVDEGPRQLTMHGERGKDEPRDAKGGIPSVDEWMGFFSKTLLRLATDFYIDLAFSGVDENIVSDRDIGRIKLKIEERDRIARPLAEFSNKSKFMRKHGRTIVASGESIDSVIQLGMWVSRVNRIAARYKRMMANGYQPPTEQRYKAPRMRVPQTAPPSSEVNGHERARQSPTDAGTTRPDIADGVIISPGSS